MPELDVSFREMTAADIPAGLELCRASRWNQTERDWRSFLTMAPRRVLVAVENGAVIGTVAAIPYGPFAWIAMVLVAPAARKRGVGTLLLRRGLALVPEGAVARLDATPAGEPIYRKLGFVGEHPLARLFLEAGSRRRASVSGVRRLEAKDLGAVQDLDRRAFGGARAALLERFAHEAPEYAWVADEGGEIAGFLLGRHGHVREHLGPLVAHTTDLAAALLDACMASYPERGFFIDVPGDRESWRRHLDALGFSIERPFLRMRRGVLEDPGEPARVFAIAGPEFG